MKTITIASRPEQLRNELKQAAALGYRALNVKLETGYHTLERTLNLYASDWDELIIEGPADRGAIIGSGRRIEGWERTEINGCAAWSAYVEMGWNFRQLFINGSRQRRACWPKYSRTNPPQRRLSEVARQTPMSPLFPPHDDPANRFKLDEEGMAYGSSLIGTEVVCLHRWMDERHPIVSIDEDGWLVSSKLGVCSKLEHGKNARYYIDNLREGLTEPGEWYLDYNAGRVFIIVDEGVDPNEMEVIAPTLTHLVKIDGSNQQESQRITFKNVTFAHSEWRMGRGGRQLDIHRQQSQVFRNLDSEIGYSGFCQAAAQAPASIEMLDTDRVSFLDCEFKHLGGYALFVGEGCHESVIARCHIHDLGAGGIHFSGDLDPSNYCPQTCCPEESENPYLKVEGSKRTNGSHRVGSCHIENGGSVFHSAIGVLMRHTSHNIVRGNEIHDFYYSGVSCGWVWHFGEQPSHHNLIENNHIYSIGRRWLSDMGGIYILGEQPGTVVRGNRIHDISVQTYGAWGIYIDMSGSHILVEKNVVYGPLEEPFVVHFGKANEVRHNIFAFGSGGAMQLGKGDEETQVVDFHHNILLVNDQPAYKGGYKMDWLKFRKNVNTHQNLYWNFGDEDLRIDNLGARNLVDPVPDEEDGEGNQWMVEGEASAHSVDWLTLEHWQSAGYDSDLIISNPKMVDPENGDFRLLADSPALELGFEKE